MVDYLRQLTCCNEDCYTLEAEEDLFNYFGIDLNRYHVELKDGINIRTGSSIKLDDFDKIDYDKYPPILLIHGVYSGIGVWVRNIETLKKFENPIFAIDLPGFGVSSRVSFSQEPNEIIDDFCSYIKLWKEKLGLKKFIIISHSFGCYLTVFYSVKYPEDVITFTLIDPWGIMDVHRYTIDYIIRKGILFLTEKIITRRFLYLFILKLIRPLHVSDIIRLFGQNYGNMILSVFGKKSLTSFSKGVGAEASEKLTRYIFMINHFLPSGEVAFSYLLDKYFMAKFPLIDEFHKLKIDKKINIMFGQNSYLDIDYGYLLKNINEHLDIQVHSIPDACHIPFIQSPRDFNILISQIIQQLNNQY